MSPAPFGGSGITEGLWDRLCALAPPGSFVLELGSGPVSTPRLAARYRTLSVEHDRAYVGLVPGAPYAWAPLVRGWYSAWAVRRALAKAPRPDVILVDGPVGSEARCRFAEHLGLFDLTAALVIDDTWRPGESAMAEELGRITGRAVERHEFFCVIP